jgi:cation transport regulator ChaC
MMANTVYIFGYGSLIYAEGINGRGLVKTYTEQDLIVTRLKGYRREWNALDADGWTYLGLAEDPESTVNGILFPLETDRKDIRNFDTSEAIHTLYDLVDVTDLVEADPDALVLTDVTKHPQYGGKIDPDYWAMLNTGFKIRGAAFQAEFQRTTFYQAIGKAP